MEEKGLTASSSSLWLPVRHCTSLYQQGQGEVLARTPWVKKEIGSQFAVWCLYRRLKLFCEYNSFILPIGSRATQELRGEMSVTPRMGLHCNQTWDCGSPRDGEARRHGACKAAKTTRSEAYGCFLTSSGRFCRLCWNAFFPWIAWYWCPGKTNMSSKSSFPCGSARERTTWWSLFGEI